MSCKCKDYYESCDYDLGCCKSSGVYYGSGSVYWFKENNTVLEGWQCPVCKVVWAPTIQCCMCTLCTQKYP